MQEEWRDIKGYEGKYQVSNLGRVYSFYKNKILSIKTKNSDYLEISLYDDRKSIKRKTFLIHRLVAEAFIENPNNYKEVNHKDENKSNNCVENLEWCDRKYNNNYGTRTQRMLENRAYFKGSKHPNSHKVQCITTGKRFNCIKDAAEYYEIQYQDISKCCRGKLKSAGKHPVTGEKLVWKYID